MKKAVDKVASFLYFAASLLQALTLRHGFRDNNEKKQVDMKVERS
jgi:hypothetical protein